MCWPLYVGYFQPIKNFDFQFLHSKPFFLYRPLWPIHLKDVWIFLCLFWCEKFARGTHPPKHLRKSFNNFFDIKFPGNWFGFGIIMDDFFISLSLCFKILNILEFNQIISFQPHDQVWTVLELIYEWTAEPSSDSTYFCVLIIL